MSTIRMSWTHTPANNLAVAAVEVFVRLTTHHRPSSLSGRGECSCGRLVLVPNSHLWLLEVGFFPAATPRATVTTGWLNQVRVSSVVCASTPDNPRSKWPERRTVLVTRELARYKVHIAALSETRFSEQSQLEEVGAGYTFFWSGWPKAERRDAGVTFAIRNDIVGRLPCLPQGINDRLKSLRLPLRGDKFTTIISVYAPPMMTSDVAKDKFFEDCTLCWRLRRNMTSHADAPSVAALAAAEICSRPEARSTGSACNQGDRPCRSLDRSPSRHLPDEAPTATPMKAPRKVKNDEQGHFEEIAEATANQLGDLGGPRKDTLKKSLKQLQINSATWEDLANFEEIAEATANQPGDLGGPRPGLTGMKKIREDWFRNL
ncbi:unnamed protein product [Schistocephalus solidus]|uniref:Uncharacterized protein n=1 Tax=Schistocephalus solidus TaxID=70667 RepID=A0A183T094_SCHSO|nr:unnamed protein product [Schistocephalus solidus]